MAYDPIGEELDVYCFVKSLEAEERWRKTRYLKISDKALRRFLRTGWTRSDGTRGSVIRNYNHGKLKRLALNEYRKLNESFKDPQGVFIVGYNSRGQCYCAEYGQLKRCGWKG